jgi:hypothetical protein
LAVEGPFRDAGSRGEDVAEALSKLAERRAELEEYARRHGAGSRSWQPDDHAKQLALKHGRGDEYTALLVANQFVHGATAAISERYSQVTENTVEVGGPAVELETWGAGHRPLRGEIGAPCRSRCLCHLRVAGAA